MKVRDLDELLGIPARMAIIATLASGNRLTFTALKQETGLADGNLHVQTGKLTAAGYLVSDRGRQGNRRVTNFTLTDKGLRVLQEHVRRLNAALAPDGSGAGGGWSPDSQIRRKPDDGSRVW